MSKRTGWVAACLLAGALTLGVPIASGNHSVSGSPGELGLSESELRETETEMLGAAHAAEHAKQRALARVQEASGAATQSTGLETSAAGPPAQVGQWGAAFSIPIFGINAVMLPTGKVMWWSYPFSPETPRANTAEAWLWDPATGATTKVNPPLGQDYDGDGQRDPANIWCSGQSMLADGRVLVTGGNLEYAAAEGWKGLNAVYTFNPFNETWTEQPSMQQGRWYPSQVLLPDGRTVIMGGFDESGTDAHAKEIELFTPSPDMNGVGQLTTIATRGGTGPPEGGWLYPRMFGMPSGRTMIAGPDPGDSWYFDPVGPAPGNSFSWGDRANFEDSSLWSTSFFEPGGPLGSSKVTQTGGIPFLPAPQDAPLSTAVTFDDANPGLGWQPAPPLNIGRAHHNTVLLPDGSKLAVGGGVGNRPPDGLYAFEDPQRQIELYDPASGSWSLGPAQAEGRAYHSTAVLLPDGRVISAGDNYNGGATSDSAEIYEPPYLFKGARPAINSAPDSVAWGDDFGINSPDSVSRAVLMSPAATTHGNDMNQRHVELQVSNTVGGAGINVVSPPDGRVAPPGYYMLFLLNQQGVPSIARWIRLDPSAPDRPVISPSPGAAFLGTGKRAVALEKCTKKRGKPRKRCRRKANRLPI
jgi:hypothetical protein